MSKSFGTPHYLAVLLTTLVLGVSTLAYPMLGTDAGVFSYVGNTILEGGLPYRDAWDPTGPAVYFVYAGKSALLGDSDLSIRFFDLIWQLCAALAVMHIGLRAFGLRVVGLSAGVLYVVAYYSRYFPDMAGPDALVTLPLALAILFCLKAIDIDRLRSWALAGALVGVAALFKLPMGLAGIFMILAAVMAKPLDLARISRRLVSLALGFAIPLFLCAGYFALRGGLHDLLLTLFVLGPEYVERARAEPSVACLVDRAVRLSLIPLYVMATLVLGWLALSIGNRRRRSLPLLLIAGWCAITVFILVWHGKYNTAHSLPLIAPLALLSAHAVHSLFFAGRMFSSLLRAMSLALIGLALLLPVVERGRRNLIFSVGAVSGRPELTHWFNLRTWDDLAKYLAANTSPEETVFLWGNQSSIYVDANRRSPTRFIHIYFLSMPWRSMPLRATFLEEFNANRPTYFVLVKDTQQSPCAHLYAGAFPAFRQFDELTEIIERYYDAELETGPFKIFRLKGGRDDNSDRRLHGPEHVLARLDR